MAKNPERFISQSKNTEFDVTRAKILIGDFLARFDTPCTPDTLREILTVNETVIAYFTYVEAYEQMLANAMLTLDDKGFVTLTETGRQLVSELSDLAVQKLRDKALASGESYFLDKKTRRDTCVKLVENGSLSGAQCECFDNGITLMRITLFYSEKELADYMRSLMNADPVGLYCKVFDRLLRVTLDLEEFEPQSQIDKNLLDGVQRLRLFHHKLLECGESRHPEHGRPVDAGEVAHQLLVGHLMVVGIHVAQLHHIVAGLGDALLDGIHLLHTIGSCRLIVT